LTPASPQGDRAGYSIFDYPGEILSLANGNAFCNIELMTRSPDPANNQPTRLWGGRFRKEPDAAMMRLSSAAVEHARLIGDDIAGSCAHADALLMEGLISRAERDVLVNALHGIDREVAAGALQPSSEDEDIHTFVERVLIARTGDTGGKLRAGRSRNDQAANNLKRYLRREAGLLCLEMADMATALADRAEQTAACPCPGFTHLQGAQPVTCGHWLMAHAEPLHRNMTRFRDFHARSASSPLGAAALAGSALVKTPDVSAASLGYARSFENSVDAVAARDHVAEFLFAAAMTITDLSRLAEEVTLWASRQFGWITLDDAFATGSSIMPQKKNPDIAEITRGRAARLTGDLVTMLGAIKGLPLSYNRDLAEDKRAAFDAVDVLHAVLPAFTGLIHTMQINAGTMAVQAADGFTLATEVADYLARNGVPFSEAHEITGALVRYCEDMGKDLGQLDAVDLAAVHAALGSDLLPHLTVTAAIAARNGPGGTAPERVREAIGDLRLRLATTGSWAGSFGT
jgi:argininosuccinate lyase